MLNKAKDIIITIKGKMNLNFKDLKCYDQFLKWYLLNIFLFF